MALNYQRLIFLYFIIKLLLNLIIVLHMDDRDDIEYYGE